VKARREPKLARATAQSGQTLSSGRFADMRCVLAVEQHAVQVENVKLAIDGKTTKNAFRAADPTFENRLGW